MHIDLPNVNLEQFKEKPFEVGNKLKISLLLSLVGVICFVISLALDSERAWHIYYINFLFFFGLGFAGPIISCIFQIVRAKWSATTRRLIESTVFFIPVGLVLYFATWFGKGTLFPWGSAPRSGTEWWMQPGFAFLRNGMLLSIVGFLCWKLVRMSMACDVAKLKDLGGSVSRFKWLSGINTEKSVEQIHVSMSYLAPTTVICYGIAYSLFAFEHVLAMDKMWVSNLFGAFLFVGNIYAGWCLLTVLSFFLKGDKDFGAVVTESFFWDIGKLQLGFTMLWGYFVISQYLPQWYGNLPEETGWLGLRLLDSPWKGLAYFTFGCGFVVPFILLMSEDIKKYAPTLVLVAMIQWIGVYSDKVLYVLPFTGELSFSVLDLGVFLGFAGLFSSCIFYFLSGVPKIAIGHFLTQHRNEW